LENRLMFENQLGLRENPFAAGHHPRFVYPSHEHQEALAHLRYGIENREPFVLITGEVGTGKTTAIYDALASWGTRAIVALITNSALTRTELLEEIALRFGITLPAPISKPKLLTALEHRLREIRAHDEFAILLVDEAQNLDRDLLEEIRLLSNLEQTGERLLQIFLVGQPELEAKLARPELRQLRQRIVIHYRLRPLSEADTAHYIHHRVAVAGGNAPELFPTPSCNEVHRLTHGIPREINTVAGQALINAFVEDSLVVQPEHVRSVAVETEFRSVLEAEAGAPQGNGQRRAEQPERDPGAPPRPEIEMPPARPDVEIPRQAPEIEPPPTGPGVGDPARTPEIDVPPPRPEIQPPSPVEPRPQPPPIKAPAVAAAAPHVRPAASAPESAEGVKMPAWLDEAIARRTHAKAEPPAAIPDDADITDDASGMVSLFEPESTAEPESEPDVMEASAAGEWASPPDMKEEPDWSDTSYAAHSESSRYQPEIPRTHGAPALRLESRPDAWQPNPGGGMTPDFLSPRLREKLAAHEEMMSDGEQQPGRLLPWMVSAGLLAAVVIGLILAVRFGAPLPFISGRRDSIEEPAQATPPGATPGGAPQGEVSAGGTQASGASPSGGSAGSVPPAGSSSSSEPLGGATQTSLPPAPTAAAPAPAPAPRVEAPKAARPAPSKASIASTTLPRAHAMTTAAGSASSRAKPARETAPPSRYGIDVGTYLNEERAATERQRLDAATSLASRLLTITEDGVPLYRILVGSFQSREEAERAASDLISRGLVNEARVVALAAKER
jgi:type II secretory pathway predicted ATPase ExeA